MQKTVFVQRFQKSMQKPVFVHAGGAAGPAPESARRASAHPFVAGWLANRPTREPAGPRTGRPANGTLPRFRRVPFLRILQYPAYREDGREPRPRCGRSGGGPAQAPVRDAGGDDPPAVATEVDRAVSVGFSGAGEVGEPMKREIEEGDWRKLQTGALQSGMIRAVSACVAWKGGRYGG